MKFLLYRRHWIELSLTMIVIFMSFGSTYFGVTKDVAWIVSICTGFVGASVAIIKQNIYEVSESTMNNIRESLIPYVKILNLLSSFEGISYKHADRIIKETIKSLEKISKGEITLNQSMYYSDIDDCMKLVSRLVNWFPYIYPLNTHEFQSVFREAWSRQMVSHTRHYDTQYIGVFGYVAL